MTPAEKILREQFSPAGTFGVQTSWEAIFGCSKSHLHLRAGASVAGFIVDFYCHPVKITRGLRQVRAGYRSGLRPDRFYHGGNQSDFFGWQKA